MSFKKNIIFLLLSVLYFISSPAYAVLKVDITRGQMNPMPIAIDNFTGDAMGAEMVKVVAADLERSGLFRPIDSNAFIERNVGIEATPRFADWRQINAQAVVTGSITPAGNGKVTVAFRLWDVLSEKQFSGKTFSTDPANWRRVSHMVADEIYARLTGEGAYFDSRIVYVAEEDRGARKVRQHRLAMMDQDGANRVYLSDGMDMVLSPRFSPTSQKIIYMGYHGRIPAVYLYDIETGRETLIGNFKGMSFAPRFSPDGTKAVMSVSDDGNIEIYELDLASRTATRLTRHPGIDTSPSYSTDGSKIVFNSDRGGPQQLYVMNRDGSNVKRISFGKGRYGTPVWSPRGDFIAFTKQSGGNFHIGVMRSDGSGERMLTESYFDEAPTWSPNGRVLMFTRKDRGSRGREGVSRLYSVDLTGYNERMVRTPSEASDPAWSPLLSK